MTPRTKAGADLYDSMRESAVGLPERLTGKWPYLEAVRAIEDEMLDKVAAVVKAQYPDDGSPRSIVTNQSRVHRRIVLGLIEHIRRDDE